MGLYIADVEVLEVAIAPKLKQQQDRDDFALATYAASSL